MTTERARRKRNQQKTSVEKPFLIVAIGASAGGLEALQQFFTHMPPDSGMAFIVIQHLDPVRHSSMPEIMSRLTKMPVSVATDGMKVAPDSIYLIPPDKNMGIQDGALYLQEVAQPRGLRLPIDFFLRSLAKERGANAICIILSGTGADGTLGLRALKAELGAVFVQEPESARYDGMPRSAINTGLADFVLPPEEMPRQIIQFVKHVAVNGARISAAGEPAEPLQHVLALLRTRTGHDFSRYKETTVRRRLERRMSVNGIDNIAEYARFLRENEPEARALLKDLLISVTSFFRDHEAFDALKKRLTELVSAKSQYSDLRVWVAGCATGEEAYSVGMVISECLDEVEKRFQVQVYATDIDTDALNIARAGIYPANIAADLSPVRLKRFFLKEGDSYRIKKELREIVVFAPQDLIKDPPFSRMDLICCRNLLIYLESDAQKRLLPLLHYALRPGGILFLGPSETVGDATDLFSTLHKKWKIFQRVERAVPPERLGFPAAFAPSVRELTAEPAADLTARLPALMEKIFLDNYAPTFAVIDEKYRLVYVRGHTGKYLEIASGQPSLSVMDMAREGLRSDLTSAIHETTKQKKMVIREGVRVKYNGGFQVINLTVAPLTERGVPPGLLMVVFQEAGLAITEGKAEPASGRRRRLARVEEELRLTKENLQNTIEELEAANEEMRSANEELQSNNEELQSINEELDTSREELQSLNEEMLTVNSELSTKNELLARANDDLKNYLNRTDIAIVFLDNELNIRTYTPATADVFNIRDIDIGRPLDEITSRLAYESVVDNAREVLRTLQPREIEVQRKDGRWYYMRILPYLTVQNAIDGVVMSFLNIDRQKQAEARSRLLATVVEDSNDAITTQDMEGRILTWNRGAEQMYGYTEAEALKMDFAQLAPEEERVQDLNSLEDIKHGKNIESLEVRRRTKDGRIIDAWLTISKVVDDQGHIVGLATTERDVTQRKRGEEEMKTLAGRLVEAQEAERRFVARELHDQVGQVITGLKLSLDQVERLPVEEWKETLVQAKKLTDELLAQVRNLSLMLRPPMLEDLGLLPALLWQFERYTSQTGIRVDLRHGGIEAPMAPAVAVAAYRIVQEALTNVARHAGVEVVSIDVSVTDSCLRLQVEDQGSGFDVESRDARESSGLTGMRERAFALGGWLTVESAPGKGTSIVAELPVTQAASE